jgi:hypothetical protein
MPWVRLDDGYPEHPKVDQVGPLAAWLNVCAWAYCARNLTDGFVPGAQVSRLANVKQPDKLSQKLVAARLWECVEGGYQVHDYLAYNPSRAQVMKERDKASERARNARSSPEHPMNKPRSSPEVREKFSTPVPGPIPDTSPGLVPPQPPLDSARRCRECHEGVVYAPDGLDVTPDPEFDGLCARCLIVAQQRTKATARR